MLLILKFLTLYDFLHIQWLDKVQCLVTCLILSVMILVVKVVYAHWYLVEDG